jgi:predicted Fe-Mo cluster-binding NifX family protein
MKINKPLPNKLQTDSFHYVFKRSKSLTEVKIRKMSCISLKSETSAFKNKNHSETKKNQILNQITNQNTDQIENNM